MRSKRAVADVWPALTRHILFAGALAALAAPAARAVPLEIYGQLPTVDDVNISPDGRSIAYAVTSGSQRAVVISSIDDHKVVAGIKMGDQKLRDLQWADNDHLLVTTSTARPAIGVTGPKQEWSLVQSISVSTGQQMPLLQSFENAMNVVVGAPQPRSIDGHTVVFLTGVTFVNNEGVHALFSVDLDARRTKLVETGNGNTEGWLLDESGNVIADSEYIERSQTWRLRVHDGGTWHEAMSVAAPIDTPGIAGVTPDGGALLVTMPDADDEMIRLPSGTPEATNLLGDSYTSVVTDPVTHRLIGTVTMAEGTRYRFLDRDDQAVWDSVANAYAGENVELVSWSADRKRVVVRVDGTRDGTVYQLVDLNTHHAMVLGSIYKGIDFTSVAPVTFIHYRAADGTDIPAYLTLPLGRDPKNLPLIVLPHGGPQARDDAEFDWWSQAIASRGYAVLQPEFRGSAGFGNRFLEAGYGQWGRKMQSDVSDGVRALAARGTIDPKRVCVVGGSYGGYVALAGATLEHGVYRCAVSYGGVSDPRGMLKAVRADMGRYDSAAMRFWTRYMGAQDMDDPKLAEISPLAHAAQADIPILLIAGKDDTVVPIRQSEDMADALKAAGKPVRLVELEGEDHWLSRSETRLQMLTETVAFLEANNPPD